MLVAYSAWRIVKPFVAIFTASPASVGGGVIIFYNQKGLGYSGNISLRSYYTAVIAYKMVRAITSEYDVPSDEGIAYKLEGDYL